MKLGKMKPTGIIFWLLIACIASMVAVQLFSKQDTSNFFNVMETLIKIIGGGLGGAAWGEKYYESKPKKEVEK